MEQIDVLLIEKMQCYNLERKYFGKIIRGCA